jgi:hypothetical protein
MSEENEVTGTPAHQVVSLDLELANLQMATRGAAILSDIQLHRAFIDELSEDAGPICIGAIVALVETRLGLVRRVLRGEERPARLWAPHNAVVNVEALKEVPDVYLSSWGALCTVPPMDTATDPETWAPEVPSDEQEEQKEPPLSASEPIPAPGQEANSTDGAGEGAPSVAAPEVPEGKRKRGPARQHRSQRNAPPKAAP